MKWRRGSGGLTRVEDGRGQRGGFGMPGGAMGAGLGGLGVIGIVLALVFTVFTGGGGGFDVSGVPQLPGAQAAPDQTGELDTQADLRDFTVFVADDVQASWNEIFQSAGRSYAPGGLVLFSGGTVSGCGSASSATGPFYCPGDQKVYVDLSFYRELQSRFGAPGDFAQAYVIAHEVGHHVRTVLGTNSQVQQLSRENPDAANELSVRLELQADCYAGVWANSADTRGLLEQGDIEEGLTAPQPSATTASSSRLRAASTPSPGRTAPPSSASNGSAAVSRAAIRTPATPSPGVSRNPRETSRRGRRARRRRRPPRPSAGRTPCPSGGRTGSSRRSPCRPPRARDARCRRSSRRRAPRR